MSMGKHGGRGAHRGSPKGGCRKKAVSMAALACAAVIVLAGILLR